jgi:hypothetical protein
MDTIVQVPEWLGAAAIGAVVAALGYVARLAIESWRDIREAQSARRARLVELQSLLRAAWVSYAVQNKHAGRLLSMVRENHPHLVDPEEGYERTFSKAHPSFTAEEKELHAIVRSITTFSLRLTNQSL